MENISDWKPSYQKYENGGMKTIYLDRSWFCDETSKIHHSEKAVLNCPYCKKLYYKPKD